MEELDLKELLKIFWERKLQIILIVFIFLVIGIVYSMFLVTPKYTATTSLLLTSSTSGEKEETSITTTDLTLNSKLVPTYSELVKSKEVIERVISNVGVEVDEKLVRNNISVSAKKNTDLLEIELTLPDPNMAEKIANETANVFIGFVKEYYKVDNLKVVDEAIVPNTPSNMNHTRNLTIFAFLGFFVSCGYVFLIKVLDNTVKLQEEIEEKYGIPVLAIIPKYNIEMERNGRR